MVDAPHQTAGLATRRGLGAFGAVAAFWMAGLALTLLDVADGELFYSDFDHRMRALQVRELLEHGAWFDRTIQAIAMPEAYVSPWSRLVDAPYVFLTLLLQPWFGASEAFHLATLVIPPLLLLGLAVPSVFVMRTILGGPVPVLHIVLAVLFMTPAIFEFSPGRIDHHNFQLVLMAAMFAGFVMPDLRVGGLLAGLAVVLSVAVGLESLPFIALGFGVLASFAVAGEDKAVSRLSYSGIAMLTASPLAGLALIGPAAMLGTECDALSAPWLSALMGGGAIIALLPAAWQGRGTAFRAGSLAIAILVLGLFLAAAFPSCLAGPYWMIDPVSRAFWLDRVPQEGGVLTFFAHRKFEIILPLVVCMFLAIASVLRAAVAWHSRDAGVLAVWIVAIASLALALVQIRFLRFPPAFLGLFLPFAIALAARNLRLVSVAALVPALAAALLVALVPPVVRLPDAVDLMDADECAGADFSVLDRIAPARIIAPNGLAFAIAERMDGNSVAALNFHRASPGIRKVALAFTGVTSAERREGLEPFDYVAVCRRDAGIDLSSAPLFAALAAGKGWPGLEPVEPAGEGGLGLWRIVPSAIR
jgi:hypothetical protein